MGVLESTGGRGEEVGGWGLGGGGGGGSGSRYRLN